MNARRNGGLLVAVLAAGLGITAAPPAAAQPLLSEAGPDGAFRSPRNFALELRFGPFRPDVDREFAGTGQRPHEIYFGRGRRLMTQLEIDYQLFQGFGSFAIGGVIGYFRQNARAFVETGAGNPTDERTGDNTRLSLIPTALLGVYRFDVLAYRYGIPFVPYAKAGLNYTLWTVYDGNDRVARSGDRRARGASLGWQGTVGVSFLLDVIEPGSARELDGETGINHTHLFLELQTVRSPAFGRSDTLHVGGSTWYLGLMFEF
jgi:hypothetical protein